MRFLVTGGTGFLGTNLCYSLLSNGHKVICLDNNSTGFQDNIAELLKNNNFEYVNHDLVKPFFPEEIDGIFNLASPASPPHYQFNPIRTLKMGTLAIYNILGMATRLGVPVLQASTSEIYGDPLEHPQTEQYWGNVNPIGPRACYDEGKRVAEALFVSYRDYQNVDIRIARIFNTYGPFMNPNDGRVVSNFINQALRSEKLTIYGHGNQTRSFCYVDDLIDGLIKLMESGFQNPVNIGNPHEIKIKDLVDSISDALGKELRVTSKPMPIDDPKRRCPDITLAKKILKWEPTTNLKYGIAKTVNYYKNLKEKNEQ